MTLRWTSMTDVDREREYSPSSCLADGDYQPYVVHYRRASDAAWSRVLERSESSTHAIAFGDLGTRTIDVAVPTSDQPVPLLAFIHGGYWQELTAADSRFAADACLSRGWGFAAIDYTLAPDASLDQIVEECCQAVRSLADRAESLGVDATRLVLAGSSAGAHLAAMAAINSGEDGPERAGTNTGV
ncbi:MAG: alpha/beta hydrolase, partial [Actinomycetia bacterium]|nr:alpha/beta hydrolase [Actinomycetes bacterium]